MFRLVCCLCQKEVLYGFHHHQLKTLIYNLDSYLYLLLVLFVMLLLILGVAYKPNINDLRESPAFDVIHLLQEKGALVSYYDPFVPEVDFEFVRMNSEKDLAAAVEKADCVAIITNHSKVDYNLVFEKAQLIFDARNALKDIAKKSPKVVKL